MQEDVGGKRELETGVPGGVMVCCVGEQEAVLLIKTMVRCCAVPNCANKMSNNTPRSFHRLPFHNRETLKLWLLVLQMDANTPVQKLRLADYRVCSDHFDRFDYCQPKKRRKHPVPKHFFLKKTAVPRVNMPAADRVEVMLAEAITRKQPL